MWTEEKMEEAAVQHLIDIGSELYYDLMDVPMFHGEYDDVEKHIMNAFLAGAKFIIKNTQKENESIS